MVKLVQPPIPGSDAFGFTERNRKTIHSIFRQFKSVKEVMLFGSRATYTHRPYSDVDLCIMNADFDQQEYINITIAFEESDLPFFTDVLVFNRLQNEALKMEILNNGKPIYSKAL